MRIAICSHGDNGMNEWKDVSYPNKQKYCDKHGYDFFGSDFKFDGRHPSWARLPMILELIKDYDWVFWSDPDSLIVNTDIKLESFIDDKYDFIISDTEVINFGEFFVKNSPLGIEILNDINNQRQFLDHVWRENQACIYLFEEYYGKHITDHILIEKDASYNRFANIYRDGDFIIHYPGAYKNIEHFKELSTKIKY